MRRALGHLAWHRLLALSVLMALLTGTARAQVEAGEAAFFDRVAACAAVMKSQVLGLRERHRGGDASVQPEILRLTELTFAMVGTAYLRGLRGEPADRLLDAAEAAQQSWPDARRQALSAQCQVEAAGLYEDANFLERMLVRNRAAKRVAQLLDPNR